MTADTEPQPESHEFETVGQALLDLAARLPDGYQQIGDDPKCQAGLYVSYDAGDEVWEIEFGSLDYDRNFTMQDTSLETLLVRARDRDREKAPNV